MAGYWSATAPRIPWDRDGSVLAVWDAQNIVTRLPQPALTFLNGENGDNTNSAFQQQWGTGTNINNFIAVAVLFPFPRDIFAIFAFNATHPLTNNGTWQFSSDTTNGVDGTWSTIAAQQDNSYTKPNYRQASGLVIPAQSSNTENVRGVRLWYGFSGSSYYGTNASVRTLHIYGWPSTGATNERLEFWHPDNNVILPSNWFDFGDFPRSSSADKRFRIKNLSTAKTANTVILQPEVLSDTVPAVSAQLTIGDPSSSFAGMQTIGSIAPGAISAVYTLRRVSPADAQLSTWTARLNTTVTSWT